MCRPTEETPLTVSNGGATGEGGGKLAVTGPLTGLFAWFGFRYGNPLAIPSSPSSSREAAAAIDMRRAMLSSFSTDYNVVSISLALHILQFLHPHGVSTANTAICSSALLAGMVAGQLLGGALGDLLGSRNAALAVVMWMQVVAALLSAFSVGFSIGGTTIQVSMFTTLACEYMCTV